jgi:LysM repeat protein
LKRQALRKSEAPIPLRRTERILSFVAWFVALAAVFFAAYLGWSAYCRRAQPSSAVGANRSGFADPGTLAEDVALPLASLGQAGKTQFISPRPVLHTTIPNRTRQEIINYTVQQGDSVFEIAANFDLKPETVLWANYAQLNDNPHMISIGMQLNIPPADGVLYEWQAGDTLEAVAGRFDVNVVDILNWPGNHLDLADPQIEPGALVLVPGGQREFRQWLIPTIPRGSAGVSKAVYGEGACEGSYTGAYGTGSFIWPVINHVLSGNDYWSGHLAIDIAAGEGEQVHASDGGVIVFSGWATGGYGNMIMIDHGNGYQTLYAHLSKAGIGCGRSVSQGGVIGYAGSTGNSTGTHLHFEVRYLGGFISPWFVLPAP